MIDQNQCMTKRDHIPLENISASLNTKQQYQYYLAGWRAFLLNLSKEAPDFTKVKLDEGFTHHKNAVVEKAISRLRKAWYDGYYDARTESRLRSVLKKSDSDLILITKKGFCERT